MLARRLASHLPLGWRAAQGSTLWMRLRYAHTLSVEASYEILRLPEGASLKEVKKAYFKMAKQTHPDAAHCSADKPGEEKDLPSFIEVITAFEVLEDHASNMASLDSEYRTAPNSAARSGGGSSSDVRRRRAQRTPARARSLGEVLCDRLSDDPQLARDVWNEIRSRKLRLEPATLDRLFEACARAATPNEGDGGLEVALSIMREASRDGILTPSLREAGLVSVIKWCKRDASSFQQIYASIDEEDKTASTMETISYANFLYSGAWDGYSSGK
mmetsp:Transcript_2342/g.7542  ORF Transcript_2342/g.7542 Transcript_2342/m.7542 type:complete len:273 (+) Transcript_2342:14-832(+)|eukprot:scaffold292834_cov30-Tisochrysis_lutea.AAC.1